MSKKKTTKKDPSVHIRFTSNEYNKLDTFCKNRGGQTYTHTVKYALEKLYLTEGLDPTKHELLTSVLSPRFVIPGNIDPTSFWVFLWTLAQKYPKASSRLFWGDGVYLGIDDKSHKEIVDEIYSELETLRGKGNE